MRIAGSTAGVLTGVCVVAAYVPPGLRDRIECLEVLIIAIRDSNREVVLVGDFNSWVGLSQPLLAKSPESYLFSPWLSSCARNSECSKQFNSCGAALKRLRKNAEL